jgi:hemoglobin
MASTAFDRHGGFAAVSKVVMDFYDRALDSDEIGDFFDGVDMKRLIDHQTKFICQALGGPAAYSDEQLHQVHAHLAIRPEHFAEMARLLQGTLEAHGFPPDDIALVMDQLAARAPHVVTAPSLAAASAAAKAGAEP